MRNKRAVALAIISALAASDVLAQSQSALHPRGEQAASVAEISWVMFISAALIFLFVMAALALALYGRPALREKIANRRTIVGAGIVFPALALTALLVYTFREAAFLKRPAQPAVRIEVVGEMWWWRVRYLDATGEPEFETANDIRIPADQPVELLLTSDNVIHSFWVPNLAGKLDMIPGHVNRLRLHADAPGVFRGQCAEYCGAQHARMMFEVRALPPDEYRAWTQAQKRPAAAPEQASLQAAHLYFMHSCAACHSIRGTGAKGTLGPDLTHVGSRSTIAAGVLPNNVGAFAGWIAGSQEIKPGNNMPSFHELSGEGLRSLAEYMESLQ